jgi:hypothetical protein
MNIVGIRLNCIFRGFLFLNLNDGMTVLNDHVLRVQEILDEKFTGLIVMTGDDLCLIFKFPT